MSRSRLLAGRVEIAMVVNGQLQRRVTSVRRTLSDFLRDDLGLTGTKLGCEHGVCGACTVILDDAPVRSCLVLAVQVGDGEVRTIEGLGGGRRLTSLQESFQRHHGLQCGFCTAGILMSSTALLESEPRPDRAAIEQALAGHLCRCTGYSPIVEAVEEAANARSETPVE